MKVSSSLFLLILSLFSESIYSMKNAGFPAFSGASNQAANNGDLPHEPNLVNRMVDTIKKIDFLIRDTMERELAEKDRINLWVKDNSYLKTYKDMLPLMGGKKALKNVLDFLSDNKKSAWLSNSNFISWLIERCAYHASQVLPLEDQYYRVRFAAQIDNDAACEYLTKIIATDAKAKQMGEHLFFECSNIGALRSYEECQAMAKTIRLLAQTGIDVNKPNFSGSTPLNAAIIENHKNVIEALLDVGVDIEIADSCGLTPLMRGCKQANSVEIIKLLIAHGANVHPQVIKGELKIPLCMAVEYACKANWETSPSIKSMILEDSVSYVRLLLEGGADLNVADQAGKTPLMIASWVQDMRVAALLLEKGALASKVSKEGKTAASIARERKNHLLANELEARVLVEKINELSEALSDDASTRSITDLPTEMLFPIFGYILNDRFTREALQQGKEKAFTNVLSFLRANKALCSLLMDQSFVNWLIEQYANNVPEKEQLESKIVAALMLSNKCAAHYLTKIFQDNSQAHEIVKTLLFPSLHHYVACDEHSIVRKIKCLNAAGFDVDCTNHSNASPLMLAAFRGATIVVKELLACGADVHRKDKYDRTLLHYAVTGNTQALPLVLSYHPDINALSKKEGTVLMCLAEHHKLQELELLLRAHADPNIQDNHGNTALTLAIGDDAQKSLDTAQLLLRHGARVNVPNCYQTPLQKAREYGNEALIKLLEEHAAKEKAE